MLLAQFAISTDRSGRFFSRDRVSGSAILLMITTGIAFYFFRQGKVQQYLQWMTRSFAVALVFVEVRVVAGTTEWENLGSRVTEIIVWSCVAFSLLFADVVLQIQEQRRSRPAAIKARTAVAVAD